MLRRKVSAVTPSCSERRERIDQRKFADLADRVCSDDRTRAGTTDARLATESVHETGPGGSIYSMVSMCHLHDVNRIQQSHPKQPSALATEACPNPVEAIRSK